MKHLTYYRVALVILVFLGLGFLWGRWTARPTPAIRESVVPDESARQRRREAVPPASRNRASSVITENKTEPSLPPGRIVDPKMLGALEIKPIKSTNPLDRLAKTKLEGEGDLMKVVGVYGTLTKLSGAVSPIAEYGGIYFYDARDSGHTANTVFDPARNRYGIWSGEVIVQAPPAVLARVTQGFDLARIRNGESQAIFRAGAAFTFGPDLVRLSEFEGVQASRPDIVYGKQLPL